MQVILDAAKVLRPCIPYVRTTGTRQAASVNGWVRPHKNVEIFADVSNSEDQKPPVVLAKRWSFIALFIHIGQLSNTNRLM